MSRLRMLQVCNVGRIVGGTAACAWTVTRALPEFEHVVAFLSDVTPETRAAFSGARIERWPQCTRRAVDEVRPDVVVLHNIGGREPVSRSAVTVQYVHSAGSRAPADLTLYCSRWLAEKCGRSASDVLYQGVPLPVTEARSRAGERWCDGRFVVGRICTSTARKWPRSLIAFYAAMAKQIPDVAWEFIGCPTILQSDLQGACNGRTHFFPANWNARLRLWEWDAMLYHNPDVPESFGRTAAEGLRAGCVPIVDAVGGFIEQVTPETGFLCTGEADFAASVRAMRNRELRRRMSAAAQKHGGDLFSIREFRRRLLQRLGQAAAREVSQDRD